MTGGKNTSMTENRCNITEEIIHICLPNGWFTSIVLGVVLLVLLVSCLSTFSCCICYCVKSRKKSRELKGEEVYYSAITLTASELRKNKVTKVKSIMSLTKESYCITWVYQYLYYHSISV